MTSFMLQRYGFISDLPKIFRNNFISSTPDRPFAKEAIPKEHTMSSGWPHSFLRFCIHWTVEANPKPKTLDILASV